MVVPLAFIFTLLGIATNSIGLYVSEFDSLLLPVEFYLYSGPLITADYLTKVKSMSRS